MEEKQRRKGKSVYNSQYKGIQGNAYGRSKVGGMKESILKRNREWKANNKEKVLKNKREYDRKRRKDPKHRLDRNTSRVISLSLNGKKAGQRWEKLVGYTLEDLVKHLEKQFDAKMNWGNYGLYWWIDHIRPISSFKYENPGDRKFKECWALNNLRPLERTANQKKSNK